MTYRDEKQVNQILASAMDHIQSNANLSEILNRMASSGELYTHAIQVAKMSVQLAVAVNMDGNEQLDLCLAGLYHDAGKLLVPDQILYKPGGLTPDEMAVIKKHPQDGYDLCTGLNDRPRGIVRDHHEKNGGTGYPRGIPAVSPYCSVITVADIFSALSEPRSYHKEQTALESMTSIILFDGLDRELIMLLPTVVS